MVEDLDEKGAATREYALLLRSAQPRTSNLEVPHSGHVRHDRVDVNTLLRMSRWHGLTPQLLEYMSTGGGEGIPQAVVDRLRGEVHANIGHNLKTVGTLRRVVSVLENEAIPFLLFKGPITALDAYGSVAGRPFVDLDVLMRPEDIRRAAEALKAISFVPEVTSSLGVDQLRRFQYHLPMHHAGGRQLVELHWRVVPHYFPFAFDYEGMWARARTCDVLGVAVSAPSLDDAVLFHCLHATKHGWMRLEWASSLAHLVAGRDGVDWPLLVERARHAGIEDIVWFGLLLVQHSLGVPVPRMLREEARDKAHLWPLVADVEARLQEAHRGPLRDQMADFSVHLRLRERWCDKARYIVGLTFYPTDEDYDWAPLPNILFPLYYVLHPLRMAGMLAQRVLEKARGRALK